MFLNTILILYNLLLAYALLFQGVPGVDSFADLILLLFLLPVAVYLTFALAGRIGPVGRILAHPRLSGIRNLVFTLSLLTTGLWIFFALRGVAGPSDRLFVFLIAPLPLYFWGSAVGRFIGDLRKFRARSRPEGKPVRTVQKREPALAVSAAAAEDSKDQVTDPKRRQFLKRVGGIGLGFLVYSLLNPKQASAAFFGSVPGPGTVAIKDTTDTKIDPAIKSPTDAYGVTEIDDDSSTNTYYYGFVNKEGAWYILKEEEDVPNGEMAYRYVKGDTNFVGNWATRKTRTDYDYYDQVF